MNTQKLETIRWFVEEIKEKPDAYIWLASSGSLITGRPITPSEYYQILFNHPNAQAGAEIESILALADVKIINGVGYHNFNIALVDLELIVAWGYYNPATSYSFKNRMDDE